MPNFSVRVGTGSFENFEVQLVTSWPVVPREGEQILLQTGPSADVWRVRCVRYVVEQEEMISAEVLVSRELASATLR